MTLSLVIPRFAMLKTQLTSLASQGDDTLTGCMGMAALEALNKKINEMNDKLILSASFLDPLVKAQLVEIAKIVPKWNIDQV